MPAYKAPVEDALFLLNDVFHIERLANLPGFADATPDVLAAWRGGLSALENAGAELIEIDLPFLSDLRVAGAVIMVQEAISFHEPMLRAGAHRYGAYARHRLLAGYAYSPSAFVRAQQVRHCLNSLAGILA